MTETDERRLFERYSRAEISRRELERLLDRDLPFGDALLKLYEYELPLPRIAPDRDGPGARLLRELLARDG